ncbi:hypothetical protein [Streptomyces sp. NPDC127039]|uniref:hypothetical protein n=1 Tax=Streptomyces sp. NPDC127039 TaxID=3347115 RepID=UPI00365D7C12
MVIGNHLVSCHLQSLPTGAGADIKTLTVRFPESPTREAHAPATEPYGAQGAPRRS